MGRELYLRRLVESILQMSHEVLPLEHVICFQGVSPSEELRAYLNSIPFIRIEEWPKNIGIADGMNKIIPTLRGDLICKFDEDCVLRSPDFFKHLLTVHKLKPNAVFSPYPVGLINNPGGVLSSNREVLYSKDTDTYYTIRYVHHIGGFARIAPSALVKNWSYEPDLVAGMSGNEDGQHSTKCLQNSIPMFYLENALIVEHQESTLGQHARHGKDYFGKRF